MPASCLHRYLLQESDWLQEAKQGGEGKPRECDVITDLSAKLNVFLTYNDVKINPIYPFPQKSKDWQNTKQ